MESEVKTLCDVLHLYKQSIIDRLDKIDKDLQHVVSGLQAPDSIASSTKKYDISMQMVRMLPHYLKMLDIGKLLSESLSSTLCELERNAPPERDRRSSNSNPFLSDMETKVDLNLPEKLNKEASEPSCSGTVPEVPGEIKQSQTVSEVVVATPDIRQNPKRVPFDEDRSEIVPEVLPTVPEPRQNQKRVSFEERKQVENVKNLVTKNWRSRALELLEKKDCKSQGNNKGAIYHIPPDEMTVGKQCIVSQAYTPFEFYVQTYSALVETFEDSMNEELNRQSPIVVNNFKSKKEARMRLGEFCLAFVPDRMKYARAEVVDWERDKSDDVLIQLIDHGSRLHCSYKNLKSLSDLYAMFPKMATRCHLAGVYSPNPQSETEWPKSSKDLFYEICGMKKKTTFTTIYVHKEGDSYAVDLQRVDNPNADTLGEMLVRRGYARQEDVADDSDDDFGDLDNINELISGYDARDEARICPFTDSSGGCFKGRHCRLEHGKLSEDGITTDKVLTLSHGTLPHMVLPAEDQDVEILITGYKDTYDDFRILQENMKSNNNVSTYEPFKIYPGISEFLLVKEGQDWFRGSCMGYTNDDKIEVFFVDFGYKRDKKMKDIRQMKENFLYLPFQAVECMIHDCQEKKKLDDGVSAEFFNNYMHLEKFQGRVIESGKPLMVQLWGSNGVDMTEILKQWGLGENRIDLRPAKDGPLSCY